MIGAIDGYYHRLFPRNGACLFLGANFVLAEPVLSDLPPPWAATLRFVSGAILMLAIVGLRRENMLGLVRRHVGAYLLLGTAGIAAFNPLFFHAPRSTSADSAALIMATDSLLTTLLVVGGVTVSMFPPRNPVVARST